MELFVYDRDFALNDFIGYAKLSLGGIRVSDAKPTHKREWKPLENMPKDHKSDFFDMNHMKGKLMFWEGEQAVTGGVRRITSNTLATSLVAFKVSVGFDIKYDRMFWTNQDVPIQTRT